MPGVWRRAEVRNRAGLRRRRRLLRALRERQDLLERLSRIQRSISHGAPLQEVLDAITDGAAQLLGDRVAAVWLVDADVPGQMSIVSASGVADDLIEAVRRGPVGQGAGGRAIVEERLVVLDDYGRASDGLAQLARDGVQSAMAAPVREQGAVVGSLVVASFQAGRTYSDSEREALLAFAECAGLALTDARSVERRERMAERPLLTDISDLARAQAQTAELEERLQRAHVVEGVGHLAGQIAHDFNHVLGLVLNYASFARKALPADSPAQDDLAQVISAAEHGAALTGQLMAFGRADPGRPQSVDLAELVRATLALLRRLVPAGVTVRERCDPGVRRVHADPAQLRQVLMNLIANAFDAMPGGGELELTARNDDRDHRVVLTVRDTGCGMEPDVLARAAEPMFTTKPLGSGTGFGLAIASGIVQRAGGRLELRSRPGEGTTAEVLLPMADAPSARDDPPAEWIAAGMRPQTGTILLVEDDQAVREVTRRILVHHGYEVLEARGADEALEMARRPGAAIDLLLTDNAMGEVSGLELVARLDARARGIRVIVMSGYVAESSPDGDAPIAWLQKPFGATSLITAVRASLSAPPA